MSRVLAWATAARSRQLQVHASLATGSKYHKMILQTFCTILNRWDPTDKHLRRRTSWDLQVKSGLNGEAAHTMHANGACVVLPTYRGLPSRHIELTGGSVPSRLLRGRRIKRGL